MERNTVIKPYCNSALTLRIYINIRGDAVAF